MCKYLGFLLSFIQQQKTRREEDKSRSREEKKTQEERCFCFWSNPKIVLQGKWEYYYFYYLSHISYFLQFKKQPGGEKRKILDKDVTKPRMGCRTVLYKHIVLEMDNNKIIRLQAEKISIRFLNSPRPIKYSLMTSWLEILQTILSLLVQSHSTGKPISVPKGSFCVLFLFVLLGLQ